MSRWASTSSLIAAPAARSCCPVGQLGHHRGPLGPDGGGGVAQVAAQLGVGQRPLGRAREGCGRRAGARRRTARRACPRKVIAPVRAVAACDSVLARISARCTVRTPVRSRDRPPPMCIRQDESPAVHTSAPVLSTERILSASMAVETSGFFTAKVPPNPQHDSACGQLDQVDAAHRAQQLQRLVADPQHPQRVAGRVIGHPVREVRADIGHPEHVDQELRQLVGAARQLRRRAAASAGVAGLGGPGRRAGGGSSRCTSRDGATTAS